MNSLNVAAVQLNSQDDVEDNLRTVAKLVRDAAQRGARLVLLPENFAFFSAGDARRNVAESLVGPPGPIRSALTALAKGTRVNIVAGGFPETSTDPLRPYNTCAVFADTGSLVASYRKIHLFDVLLEETTLTESKATLAGEQPTVVEACGVKVGLSICYDLRFPELYRSLCAQGAELLVVPAAFTLHTGKDHWRVLLRARAIEAQCWVLAAAQWGRHPEGRTTYGHSMLIDPWGTVVSEASDGVGVMFGRIERQRLEDIRRELPALQHRRL
jgi:predicted amidohydrolase